MTSFYSKYELQSIGFKLYGTNVSISRYARFYRPENIIINDKEMPVKRLKDRNRGLLELQ